MKLSCLVPPLQKVPIWDLTSAFALIILILSLVGKFRDPGAYDREKESLTPHDEALLCNYPTSIHILYLSKGTDSTHLPKSTQESAGCTIY